MYVFCCGDCLHSDFSNKGENRMVKPKCPDCGTIVDSGANYFRT